MGADALGKLDTLCACTRYCLEALPELSHQNPYVLHDSWTANTAEILAAKPDERAHLRVRGRK